VTTYDAKDPNAKFPPIEPLRPPKGAPNALIVLIDDFGFGASSAFGGPVATPNAERLAASGLKFNRFHTTALCSPTRQALLTGRNHHSVNMGGICEIATSAPGYTSVLPKDKAPLAMTLKLNGYSTAPFGKCHEVPVWETSPLGPFDQWPSGGGFEYFYGFIGGETNQWYPAIYEGTTSMERGKSPEEGYHFTEDMTNKAMGWVRRQEALVADKPFFMYFAPGATHAPHHVSKEWIEKYKGKFDGGWDKLREEIFARQKKLGVIPADAVLTKRPDEIPATTCQRRSSPFSHARWRSMPGFWSIPTTISAGCSIRLRISKSSTTRSSTTSSATTAPWPKARRTVASTRLQYSTE
jgi:arylsulfatase A-like enzyme